MRPATVARLRKLGYVDYASYLRSNHWLRKRAEYRRCRPWACLCGESERLQLHHKTYERIGRERLDDLQALCDRCHSLIHDLEKQGLIGIDLKGFFDPDRKYQDVVKSESLSPREIRMANDGKARINTITHRDIKR